MSIFQQADAHATSSEKWKLMDRIFYLYDEDA
jgi:L-rhamnose mutarotase